jgi:aspartate-semialdehyde dehydrogenase
MPLNPVFGLKDVLVCNLSGHFRCGQDLWTPSPRWLTISFRIIGGGEERKSEVEPLKSWEKSSTAAIIPASNINITAQCIRVPVTDGHLAAVYARFEKKPDLDQSKRSGTSSPLSRKNSTTPSAPKKFLHYFEEQIIRRPSCTAISKTAWQFQSAVCARIRNMIIKFIRTFAQHAARERRAAAFCRRAAL